ncbi:MAG TPA: PHP domain-containing protein [Candidatus Fimivicinus intestinavium]|nr:PHP domain-containing protein [Candidatus Fimivicinus intestinavium]
MDSQKSGGFLYEMHLHTAEVSSCGNVPAEEAMRLYRKEGYAGVVVTDHLNDSTFARMKHAPWRRKIKHFLEGYRRCKALEEDGFTVLLGAELRFHGCNNDYLLYGLTEEFLVRHPHVMDMDPERFHRLARREGILFIQAHPFRNGLTVVDPRHLDGIETYNGNPRHDSRNEIAGAWAQKFGLLETSGSDFHEYEDLARGGVAFPQPVRTVQELSLALRGPHTLKKTEEH